MEATVLIPTFNHGETLRYAIASVQAQTLQDFEILIVGDGAPEATRDLVSGLASADSRIRYFGFPKGERHGELSRHAALRNAQGRCVCYLCDDDLWLPSHLEHLTAMLKHSDVANTGALRIDPSGEATLATFDFGNPIDRVLLQSNASGFGLASSGHTLEAYRRLPHGWRTTPQGIHADTYMWQQFLDQPWCRAVSSLRPTVLGFGAAFWDVEAPQRRLEGLAMWLGRATAEGGEREIAWHVFESTWGSTIHPEAQHRHARINPNSGFPPYELGTSIDLAGSYGDFQYFSWGWSFREAWGVWSDGDEARLTFSIECPLPETLTVEVRFAVSLSAKHPVTTIQLAANGLSVACWTIKEEGIHTRSVEIAPAERLDLRFLMPYSPPVNQVHGTPDHRRVGIGLLSLHVRAAP